MYLSILSSAITGVFFVAAVVFLICFLCELIELYHKTRINRLNLWLFVGLAVICVLVCLMCFSFVDLKMAGLAVLWQLVAFAVGVVAASVLTWFIFSASFERWAVRFFNPAADIF
ncbi:TPA: hypothetical protein DCQ44_00705 [Candidatus Taylorbacteria bacterium]|nr:hypothetical protein [Candidatus Taylorbacteria bacterium]